MSEAVSKFSEFAQEGQVCIDNYDSTGNEFALRYVWVTCVSALDLYMTELVSEAGLRLIDKSPRILTQNLRQVGVPLERVFELDDMSPTEKLLFYKESIFSAVRYTSFYKPDGISVALSYIWTSPPKEKWKRVLGRMKEADNYHDATEQAIREELALIGDRRDLIAHSVDWPPGRDTQNPVSREDASQVIKFVTDVANAIDKETEDQLSQ